MNKWRFPLIFVIVFTLAYLPIYQINSIYAQTPLTPVPDFHSIDKTVSPYPKLDNSLNKLITGDSTFSIYAVVPGPEIQRFGAAFATSYTGANVLVNILVSQPTHAIRSFISQAGGSISYVFHDSIEAYIPSNALPSLSELDDVRFVYNAQSPIIDIIGEGANSHNVPVWRTRGYSGSGIKVGIIDAGFSGIKALQGTEVPSTISAMCFISAGVSTTNIDHCDAGSVHGTGVTEAVLDIAPNATIYIAKIVSVGDLKAASEWMTSQGVNIINHSMGWYWTSTGDGSSTMTSSPLNTVSTAVSNGVFWVNSAGNDNGKVSNTAWNDTDSDPYLNFSCASNTEILQSNTAISSGKVFTIKIRWVDDWNSPNTDLALSLYSWNGSDWILADTSNDNQQNGSAVPIESLTGSFSSSVIFGVRIQKIWGENPSTIQVWNDGKEFLSSCQTSGSIGEPGDSLNTGMITVGASNWQTPTTIESFSSLGPTIDGRVKPDIVAVDGANSATYGSFLGTSQSSPHIAGLAALILEQYPSYSPVQIKTFLTSNALTQGLSPNNTWGYGLANLPNLVPAAPLAVNASAGFEQAFVTFTPPSDDGGSDITSYTISADPPDAEKILMAGGSLSGTLNGLSGGIPYTFSVKATNSVGTGLSAVSNSVTPSGSAKKLGFTTQPGNGSAGVLLFPQPSVAIQDMGGNTKTSSSNPVTISITSGTGKSGATLQGTTTITPVNGIATFTNLRIDNASSGYTFTATASGLQSSTSSKFTVSGASATSMIFSSFPPHGIMNQLFSPQPIVLLTDSFGNPASNTGSVSIAIAQGTGGATATLLGTKTVNIVDGVATFTDLKIDTSSRDYKLIATSSGLPAITSLPFTVWIETVGPVMNVWGIGIVGAFVLITLIYLSNKRKI